jgi:hypothetical protein
MSDALLEWNCGDSYFSNVRLFSFPSSLGRRIEGDGWIVYEVLYVLSPEIFPVKDRGTGNAMTATGTRVFDVIVRFFVFFCRQWCSDFNQGPIIALYTNLTTAVPVYISGALTLFAAGLALLVPFGSSGRASL